MGFFEKLFGTGRGQRVNPQGVSEKPPLVLIRNMREVYDGDSYETSPSTCSICGKDALVVVSTALGVPCGDIAIRPGVAGIPSKLAGYCGKCEKVIHLRCARAINMPGATVFGCTHGCDCGYLRSQS
jgi:hypothetical protein